MQTPLRVTKLLWALWGAMILAMLLRRHVDVYMTVALIIIPLIIVLIDLHEEIVQLKEENKHQRKFVMDRYNLLQEKVHDISSQVEKRLVVDFAEFARSSSSTDEDTSYRSERKPSKKQRRKKPKTEKTEMDLTGSEESNSNQ